MTSEYRGPGGITRRTFLGVAGRAGVAAATAALLPGCGSGEGGRGGGAELADGPLETTTIRMGKSPLSCFAAQAVAPEFLRMEGFTDVQYLDVPPSDRGGFARFAAGEFDMQLYPAPMATVRIEAGDPIVMLGGVQIGCFQVYGSDAVKSIRDFKGRTISTGGPGAPDDVFLTATLANVGIDVRKDVKVVTYPPDEAPQALADGVVDGISALPPFSYLLRASGVGHVVMDSMMDRPWSQYVCCMASVHRRFMENNPVATLRGLRGLLKAADVVAKDPERGARAMVSAGFTREEHYAATLEDLRMMPYDVWRTHDPSDTLRFYALRLRDAGLVKSTPAEIVSRGTDLRFLREVKQTLREA